MTDGGATQTLVFSGDIGRNDTPIVRDPTPLTHADHVIIESTYGNREHGPHEAAIDELVTAIGEVAGDEGVLLMPAFAIGRTQEVIWVLDALVRAGRIPRLPLFLDSPMASRATKVYDAHPETYDEETGQLLRSGESPLMYPGQQFTDTVEESKAIRFANRPFMIVAASGMLTGGRIMHHLKDFLPDPKCTLLFIGYQGEGTLGRHLQEGGKHRADRRQGVPGPLPRSIGERLLGPRRRARARGVARPLRPCAGRGERATEIGLHRPRRPGCGRGVRDRIRSGPGDGRPRREAPRDRGAGLTRGDARSAALSILACRGGRIRTPAVSGVRRTMPARGYLHPQEGTLMHDRPSSRPRATVRDSRAPSQERHAPMDRGDARPIAGSWSRSQP